MPGPVTGCPRHSRLAPAGRGQLPQAPLRLTRSPVLVLLVETPGSESPDRLGVCCPGVHTRRPPGPSPGHRALRLSGPGLWDSPGAWACASGACSRRPFGAGDPGSLSASVQCECSGRGHGCGCRSSELRRDGSCFGPASRPFGRLLVRRAVGRSSIGIRGINFRRVRQFTLLQLPSERPV